MSLSDLLLRARPKVEQELARLSPPYTLFLSATDGRQRAKVTHATGNDFSTLWQALVKRARKTLSNARMDASWLRLDWVTATSPMDWGSLNAQFQRTKRGYFRYGIALDPQHKVAFLEQELNGNAMLYGGNKVPYPTVNESRFRAYTNSRFGKQVALDFSAETHVYRLSTEGIFLDADTPPQKLYGPGRSAGRRIMQDLDEPQTYHLIDSSSRYLATQVKRSGLFEYGWHCCFDRAIGTYNTLRHASSTYAMTEAWEVTGDETLKSAIDRALDYLTEKLIRQVTLETGKQAAFLVESNGEIKLGGNAVCLLALVKYSEITGTRQYHPLMDALATGIHHMQDPDTGKFVHVLEYPTLSVKEAFRIIYYDGEAAFGLMRLYGLTGDQRWLQIVEKAFEYFIANNHWEAHDHWLSYCVNELTLYRQEERYYQFGIQNVKGHLDFIIERITTFPTLLELMMAAERMVTRLRQSSDFSHLLRQLDLHKFYHALHTRAMYLLNGYFWPEYAMFFQNPRKIVGSFYIRHHAFRVRIDDVEHYLSGFVAFRKYLLQGGRPKDFSAGYPRHIPPKTFSDELPALAWGGDVNLARRQHYRTAELGEEEVLGRIPALSAADLSVINLECVVATTGEQGFDKGEKSPYYYRARPEMLKLLCRAGIDVVTTANNHSGDYGIQPLLEQRYWLDGVGIGHTGSGTNLDTALKPVIRPAGNLNVAIFSIDATQHQFAAGTARPGAAYLPLDDGKAWEALLKPRIEAARRRAHIVMVAVHWGDNLEHHPGEQQISTGHHIIDAGADAILGTSAHVLQGIEIYRQRPIIHDAGDLLFDSIRRTLKDSGVFRLSLSHRGVEQVRFVPVGAGFGFSCQLTGAAATAVTQRYAAKCTQLGTALNLQEDGSAVLSLSPPARDQLALPPAHKTRYNPALLDNLQRPLHPNWTVKSVPQEAQIPEQLFGPLKLLGIRVSPQRVEARQLLWVESFWTLATPVNDDLRLDIRGVPVQETDMPHWGKSMDHDPCDWQLPTSRWQPGVIYRDFYGLRPPSSRQLRNIDLQLQVGIVGQSLKVSPRPVGLETIQVRIPGLNNTGSARTSHDRDGRKPPVYRTTFPPVIFDQQPGQAWNAEQITAVTGGTWLVPPPAGWFVRSVVSGQSFIAQSLDPVMFVAHRSLDRAYHERSDITKYRNWDLHDRLPEIVDNAGPRLAGVVVARPVTGLPEDLPVLQVEDPIQAIVELGLAARRRFSGEVVAVTGTAGKSSTLKMLDCMLGGREKVLTSLGNYNSRVGVPTMLASLHRDHECAVIEVAQSALWMKRGPITREVHPTIALITEIGISQSTSMVKTDRDTAKWKSRIFDGLTGCATAIVGEHLKHFDYIYSKAREHAKRVITFGHSPNADIRIQSIATDHRGSRVTVQTPEGEKVSFSVPAPSTGMVHNAVASLCVLYAMGRSLPQAAEKLQALTLDEGHLHQVAMPLAEGSATMIDDSWNATVSSMLNAFSVLAQTPVSAGGRKIAALGRIVQLGDQAAALHRSLATPLLESGAEYVVTHGEEMRYLREILPRELLGPHFDNARALAGFLAEELHANDLLLVKGSRRDSDFGHLPALLLHQLKTITTA